MEDLGASDLSGRPLSAMERVIWLASRRSPVNFAVTARLDGHLERERVESALRRLTPSRPLLRSRIVEVGDGALFVCAGVPECPVRVVESSSEDDWVSVTREELLKPFSCETGPLARFILLHHGSSSDLVACCHHCASDGMSAAYLLRDLLRLAANPSERLGSTLMTPSMADLIPSRVSRRPVLRAGLFVARLAADLGVSGVRLINRFRRKKVRPPAGQVGEGFRVIAWTLDQSQTERIAKRCRREKTTVHAALCAAFLMAFAERERKKIRAVSCPVSLRERLTPPVGDDFGLFICLCKVSVDTSRGSFWDVARRLKAKLNRANLWWGPLFAESVLAGRSNQEINNLMDALGAPKVSYDLSITNLGRLVFPENGAALRLRSIHGPAVSGVEGERILGVSTAAGRMAFVLTFPVSTLEPEAAIKVRDGAMGRLAAACVA